MKMTEHGHGKKVEAMAGHIESQHSCSNYKVDTFAEMAEMVPKYERVQSLQTCKNRDGKLRASLIKFPALASRKRL